MATATRSRNLGGFSNLKTDVQSYPVIDTVVTDEAVGALKGSKFEPISLAKVERLLSDPHSVSTIRFKWVMNPRN